MNSFSSFNLPNSLQMSLEKIQFLNATPIQEKAIPILLEGQDLIACSETGSGKTGSYGIPMVAQLLNDPEKCGLVLAPTRELAQQIEEFLKKLVNANEFLIVGLSGGTDIRKQFKKLQKKPRIIVATPGRLIDHLKRNTVQIHKTEILVLDEGDRMIDMGFAPQLQQILKYLPQKRQTSFFTATVDDRVNKLASQYLVKPKMVQIGQASRPVSAIKQDVMMVELKRKDECVLNEVVSREGSILIFLKTKHRTDRLQKYLQDFGVEVGQIHSDRTQGQRNRAISDFKSGKTRVLCATDIAARGIDVPQVEHVINYDLPIMDEDYVHRIGRTARNGAEGSALSFVMPDEHRAWNRLARKYQIKDVALPEGKFEGRSKDGKKFGGRSKGGGKSGSWSKEGKKKFGSRSEDGERSFGSRSEGGKKKFKSRSEDGERSFGSSFGGGKKKFGSRSEDGERSFGSRSEGGKKKFKSRSEDGERSFGSSFGGGKKKFGSRSEDGERSFGSRSEGGKKKFKSRSEDGERSFGSSFGGGKKKFKSRSGDGERSFGSGFGGDKKKFRRSEEGGDRDFSPRFEEGGKKKFKSRSEDGEREFGSRGEGSKKKFKKMPFHKNKKKSNFKQRSF